MPLFNIGDNTLSKIISVTHRTIIPLIKLKLNNYIKLKFIGKAIYVVMAILVFGGGFALMTSGNFVNGLILSLVGLVLIIGMIPVIVGLKK